MTTALDARKQVQRILLVDDDGIIGPKTIAALNRLVGVPDNIPWTQIDAVDNGVHHVKASSFADPADVEAFRKCKAQGNSDEFCFSKGDNGVGKWGDDCTEGSGPKCALPPEDWLPKYGDPGARHAKVIVTIGNVSIVCLMDDTMPHKANIKNGAGIDLNADACKLLGVKIPLMTDASWVWA